ncbi:unnamed protein product [Phytophthora lilii]|uniref:Unnamed protein product n=1 Tax=Phytophthora lilii TaxID=2077276 RepID=A0A9W6X4Q6_9STRA|nr:unnamed protein product [Phytophthora lilii]
MDTMKCNHDAQFVLSSGSKDTAAYVAKYCFKSQNPIENQAALSLAAFTKAASNANALPSDMSDVDRGYRILGSMLYTVTNRHVVAAPMAALHILNETPFWFSHEFVHVNMQSLLRTKSKSVELCVSQQDCVDSNSEQDNIAADNLLDRYWKRQSKLESLHSLISARNMATLESRTGHLEPDLEKILLHDAAEAFQTTSTGNTVGCWSILPTLQSIIGAAGREYCAANSVSLPNDFHISSYASKIISPNTVLNSDECTGTNDFILTFEDTPTRLEHLNEWFDPVAYDGIEVPARWTVETLPKFSKIAMVSEAFGLNFWLACFQEPPETANRLRQAGYAVYAAINSVVFMTKNMRARFDPEYTQFLNDLRWTTFR